MIWDLRTATDKPVVTLQDVHSSDINTVDWSALDNNLIATGSNDTLVKVIDVRQAYATKTS